MPAEWRIRKRPAAFPVVLATSSEKGGGIDELPMEQYLWGVVPREYTDGVDLAPQVAAVRWSIG